MALDNSTLVTYTPYSSPGQVGINDLPKPPKNDLQFAHREPLAGFTKIFTAQPIISDSVLFDEFTQRVLET